MKKVLITLGILVILAILLIILIALLLPWMDRWGTTSEERAARFSTDDLVPGPLLIANRGITINSSPKIIFPWILQIGADKSGMYSYTWLENLVGCKMARDETIRPEWQALQVGDLMKMCAGDFAPPPYIVAHIEPDDSVTFGHKEGENWVEILEFLPDPAGRWDHAVDNPYPYHDGYWILAGTSPNFVYYGTKNVINDKDVGRAIKVRSDFRIM